MLRIVNIIIFPLTLLSGILLSLAGLAPFVHPNYSTWLPLLGLCFPFLFLLNILWLIYWWIQLRLKMLMPLCFLILNLIHISKYVQFNKMGNPTEKTIKLASYNCQLFGSFQDSNFFGTVLNHVRAEQYKLLCIQEFYSKNDIAERVINMKKAGGFLTYSFYRLTPDRPYGMAVFSKYPIVRSGRVGLGESTGNMAIFADVLINNDTVRIYNLHLQSIRFNKKDYKFINNESKTQNSAIEGSKNLIRRLRDAYKKRAIQADSVAMHMATCRYPLIVMGDFNDVPLSYTYNRISDGLLDAFREAGSGFEKTYKGPFPNFRIDYILHSKDFKCVNYKSVNEVPGDHKLVSAEIIPGLLRRTSPNP